MSHRLCYKNNMKCRELKTQLATAAERFHPKNDLRDTLAAMPAESIMVTIIYGHERNVMKMSAAEFKAKCLKLMDEVAKTREPVVITKRGKAVAQLVPVQPEPETLFGYMNGTVKFEGDIMAPLDEQWSTLTGDEDHLYEGAPRPPARRTAARKVKTK